MPTRIFREYFVEFRSWWQRAVARASSEPEDQNVALRFRRTTAVAVGTFNIYVIQPKWLAEVKLVKKGVGVRMETDLNRPGFRYSIDGSPIKWDVRPDRLVLMSDAVEDDCGSLLAEVLGKLPWTPLSGVGLNVEFAGPAGTHDVSAGGCSLPIASQAEGYSVKQRSVHVGLERGGHVYNLQLSETDQLELAINVHTELANKGNQESVNQLATEACRSFIDFRKEAESLAERVFSVELTYE